MFDYKMLFDSFCAENAIHLHLSFEMPEGYENACGTFDFETKTVHINTECLDKAPDHEKAFYLFHELRHAWQYLFPERSGDKVRRSIRYSIQYDGTCYKLIGGTYASCRLEGGEERFTDIYLGQPHEVDANAFAYEQAKKLCGESDALRELYDFWRPRHPVPDEVYDAVYAQIDKETDMQEQDPGTSE